jgi:hypothetical protein
VEKEQAMIAFTQLPNGRVDVKTFPPVSHLLDRARSGAELSDCEKWMMDILTYIKEKDKAARKIEIVKTAAEQKYLVDGKWIKL